MGRANYTQVPADLNLTTGKQDGSIGRATQYSTTTIHIVHGSIESCYIIRYRFSHANVTDYGAAHNLLRNGVPYYGFVIFESNYCVYTESPE